MLLPLDIDKLKAVKTIICHGGNCPDGVASAILLHDVLPDAELKFVQYGTEEQKALRATSGMLFADFSPHAETFQKFVDAGAIVLDHHKGAKDITAAFGSNGCFGDETTEPGVCGAVLAFRHVWSPIKYNQSGGVDDREVRAAEDFATLAGIRDTWQNKSPRWLEACIQAEMLRFYPIEHWLKFARPFDPAIKSTWDERRQIATILVEKHAKTIEKVLEKSWRFTSAKGTKVVCFEGTHLSSDAAESAQDVDLVIGFGFTIDSGLQ